MSIIVSRWYTSRGLVVQNDTMEVYGTALETTVNSRGSMFVSGGGVARDTTVNYGGYMYVSSNGVARDTTVNNGGRMYW